MWENCTPGFFFSDPLESEDKIVNKEYYFDNEKLNSKDIFNCSFSFTGKKNRPVMIKFQRVITDPYPQCLDTGHVEVGWYRIKLGII